MTSKETKFSDLAALDTTVMAVDRTLLAWVRTSISLISFGFTIFKMLQYIQEQGIVTAVKSQTPRNIGLFLILVGIVPLFITMIDYHKTMRKLGVKENIYLKPSHIVASAIFLLGFILFLTMILHIL